MERFINKQGVTEEFMRISIIGLCVALFIDIILMAIFETYIMMWASIYYVGGVGTFLLAVFFIDMGLKTASKELEEVTHVDAVDLEGNIYPHIPIKDKNLFKVDDKFYYLTDDKMILEPKTTYEVVINPADILYFKQSFPERVIIRNGCALVPTDEAINKMFN